MKKLSTSPINLKAKSLFKFKNSPAGIVALSTGDPTTITITSATSVIGN